MNQESDERPEEPDSDSVQPGFPETVTTECGCVVVVDDDDPNDDWDDV